MTSWLSRFTGFRTEGAFAGWRVSGGVWDHAEAGLAGRGGSVNKEIGSEELTTEAQGH